MRHAPFTAQFGFDLQLHLQLLLIFYFAQHFRIMLFDVSDVGGTVKPQFQRVYVENLNIFVIFQQVLPHKLDEQLTQYLFPHFRYMVG